MTNIATRFNVVIFVFRKSKTL